MDKKTIIVHAILVFDNSKEIEVTIEAEYDWVVDSYIRCLYNYHYLTFHVTEHINSNSILDKSLSEKHIFLDPNKRFDDLEKICLCHT